LNYIKCFFQLPFKIDIIKHPSECDGKSTSAHAAVICPDDVKIYTYPCIPNYPPTEKVSLFENSIIFYTDKLYTESCNYVITWKLLFQIKLITLLKKKIVKWQICLSPPSMDVCILFQVVLVFPGENSLSMEDLIKRER